MAAALERDLSLLETERPDTPARQRSMLAALEYSWELLAPEKRRVFSRLSVLRGSFTAEDASETAGATYPILQALLDKSLLQCDVNGRFSMHELLRRFAEEKLCAAGQGDGPARREQAGAAGVGGNLLYCG
jgi:predicted ATPase